MPKKTKKSGGRSDKERESFLQQKGQAEEELKEKKEEMHQLFLMDKLQDEQRNKAMKLQKIKDSFRESLRLAQDDEQRQKIIMSQQMFENELDELDSIKKKNEKENQELDRFEEQVMRCHKEYMDTAWALQEKRLQSLHQLYESSLQEIRAGRSSQRQHQLLMSEQLESKMQKLKLTEEQQNKDALNDIEKFYKESQKNYVKTLEDMASKQCSEEMKDTIQSTIEGLQYGNKLSANFEYLVTEEKRNNDLKTLKKLEESISQLEREGIAEKERLTAAINEAKLKTETLRKERSQAQKAAKKRLTKMVMRGDATIQKLQGVIAKGERVLRRGEICSKLERKNAALLATVSTSSSGPTDEASNSPANEVVGFPELQHLQQRINNAMMVRDRMRQEKKDLRKENRELKRLIAQHKNKPALHITPAPTTSTPSGVSKSRHGDKATHTILKRK